MPQVPEKTSQIVTPKEVAPIGLARRFPPAYWLSAGGEVALYHGNCVKRLNDLPARSIHCVVTSPPYWNLRDYGTAEWEGGSGDCDHVAPFQPRSERANVSASGIGRGGAYADEQAKGATAYKSVCGKCGAKRIDQQLGAEPLHDCGTHGKAQCGGCFVCSMVAVFRGVWRVLRDDGTLWLNLGDSYTDNGLAGVPWRVALALQADGWTLVSAMPWVKANAMPESAMSRPSKAVEDVFLLTKGPGHYFDMEAIKPPTRQFRNSDLWYSSTKDVVGVGDQIAAFDVPVASYPGAHFATFSPRLITPMIQAGTSEHGCCSACGKPWERLINKTDGVPTEPDDNGRDRSLATNRNGITGSLDGVRAKSSTLGWRQSCTCKDATVEPCVVLDPFTGSGTTAATAVTLGRRGVGIDLSNKYLNENAIPRIEAALRGEKVTRKVTTLILPGKAPPVRTLGRKL